MIKTKTTESKVTPSKKNITVTDVEIIDGQLVTSDEYGEVINVADGIYENLPDGITAFDIKISIELPEEQEEVDADSLAPEDDEEEQKTSKSKKLK